MCRVLTTQDGARNLRVSLLGIDGHSTVTRDDTGPPLTTPQPELSDHEQSQLSASIQAVIQAATATPPNSPPPLSAGHQSGLSPKENTTNNHNCDSQSESDADITVPCQQTPVGRDSGGQPDSHVLQARPLRERIIASPSNNSRDSESSNPSGCDGMPDRYVSQACAFLLLEHF